MARSSSCVIRAPDHMYCTAASNRRRPSERVGRRGTGNFPSEMDRGQGRARPSAVWPILAATAAPRSRMRGPLQISGDVGGPPLGKRVVQRWRKAIEAMLETAPDIEVPPDTFAIDMMVAAMAGAMHAVLAGAASRGR